MCTFPADLAEEGLVALVPLHVDGQLRLLHEVLAADRATIQLLA